MKLLRLTIAISACLFLFQGNSQQGTPQGGSAIPDPNDLPFTEFIELHETYFNSLLAQGVNITEMIEYKEYNRTLNYYKYSQGYPDKSINEMIKEYDSWLKANGGSWNCPINSRYPYLTFDEIGPTINATGGDQGTGQIHYLEIHPTDPNKMFACSQYGGLFMTVDGGDSWFNGGTDYEMGFTSVSSIALSKTDPDNTWFLSTGNAEFYSTGVRKPATGIWRTTDGGSNYIRMTLGYQLPGEIDDAKKIRKVISIWNFGTTRLVVAADNGLWKCDNPLSIAPIWEKIADGQFYDVEVKPNDNDIVYATGDFQTPFISYRFSTGNLDIINTLDSDFSIDLSESNLNLEFRRSSIEFCKEMPEYVFLMKTDRDKDGVNGQLSSLHLYDILNDLFYDKGTITGIDNSVSTNEGIGKERAMAWDVSPEILTNGKVHLVYSNDYATIKMAEIAFDNSEVFYPADWTSIGTFSDTHPDHHYFKFNDNETVLYDGCDGGLFKTLMIAPTTSWTNLNNGLGVSTATEVSTSQNGIQEVVGSFQDMGSIIIDQDLSGDWIPRNINGGDGTHDYINKIDADKLSLSNNGAYFLTTSSLPFAPNYYKYIRFKDAAGSLVESSAVPLTNFDLNFNGNAANPDEIYSCSYYGLRENTYGVSSNTAASNLPIESFISVSNGYADPQYIFDVFPSENPKYSEYIYVYWRGGLDGRTGDPKPTAVLPRIYRSTVGPSTNSADWELVYQFSGANFGKVAVSYDNPDIFWVSEGNEVHKMDASSGSLVPIESLSGMPTVEYSGVKDLCYVNGSNNAIYIANKSGLYYTDDDNYPGSVIRICSLPNAEVTDVEIDYCRKKVVLSTYGRGIWAANMDIPQNKPFTVNSNYTMTGDFYPGTDVVVENGTLTVEGTLYMPRDAKIIVKPGAHLKVSGGTITNGCGDLWAGIQVWGKKSESQFGGIQGQVTLSSNATIEHAQVAVTLWNPGDWNSTGGIIKSYNSTFLNNKKDVEFINYSNDHNGQHYANKGFFYDTEFIWDDQFRREWPLGHVTMYKVDGVTYNGCLFADQRTDPESRYHYDYARTNSGIYSIDAKYRVLGHCNGVYSVGCDDDIESASFTPTRFENLDFGIHAANSSTEYSVVADRCIFTNNLYGALYVNLNSSNVTRSKFYFNNTDNNFGDYSQYGLHLVRSKELRIEENEFVDQGVANTTFGIVCSDLGESDEAIYKNIFTALDFGNYTQGKNRSIGSSPTNNGLQGLQFLCNDNTSNVYDHYVVGTLWGGSFSNDNGVRKQNGLISMPSKVEFSIPPLSGMGTPVGDDYNNQSYNNIRFYYSSGVADETPDAIAGNVTQLPILSNANCSSNFPSYPVFGVSAVVKSQLESDFDNSTNLLNQKKNEYNNLLDGGDTQGLLDQIAALKPNNKHQLRQTLLGFSPYLSDEVIMATADNHPSEYPHSWVKELIEANIDIARDDQFIEFLQTKTHPLPQGHVNQIITAVSSADLTDKTIRESEISELSFTRSFSADMIIRDVQHDSDAVDLTELRNWLAAKNDILSSIRLVETYIQEENFSQAEKDLNSLSTNVSTYPSYLQNELNDYISFKIKLITFLKVPGYVADLKESDLSFVQGMASTGSGIARYQAQEILCFFYDECDPYLVDAPVVPKTQISAEEKPTIRVENNFKIYPDPANDWLAIELEYMSESSVKIINMQGKTVYQEGISSMTTILDLTDLPNATYIIEITDLENQVIIGREKLVVQH